VAQTPTGSTATFTSAEASKGKAPANITDTKVKSEAPAIKLGSTIPLALTLDNSDGLPEFVRAGWVTSFLPTLYAYLLAAPTIVVHTLVNFTSAKQCK
jgi:hypothetical protein